MNVQKDNFVNVNDHKCKDLSDQESWGAQLHPHSNDDRFGDVHGYLDVSLGEPNIAALP